MSIPEDSLPASNIPQGGFRDQAEAWKIEILTASENAEQWKNEEDLQIASLLAAKFANNLPPERLAQAQVSSILSQTTAAFEQASSIVQEMQRSNFLGLNAESRVRNDRLHTAAILMVADDALFKRYNGMEYPEKQAFLEQFSQISPMMMRRAQQAGAANAALSAALQSLFPAAAARYASGMNQQSEEEQMDEQMNEQAQDGVRQVQRQAQGQAAQAIAEKQQQEENSRREQASQKAQAESQKRSPMSGKIPGSSSQTATSMSKRAKGTAWKLTGGAFGALTTLGLLSEWLSK